MKHISQQSRRRGAALIEATLTLTLFLVVLFSMFDFGYVLFLHQSIVNRTRAAARYGALNPDDLTGIQNHVVYAQTSGSGPGIFGLEPSNVSVARSGAGTYSDRIKITVSNYPFSFVTPGFAGSNTGKAIVISIPVEAR